MDSTSKLIMAFFTLVVGVVLISSLATSSNEVTDKLIISNETLDISTAVYGATGTINDSVTLTIANHPTSWKTLDCPITRFVMYNQSGVAVTSTTDYVFTASAGTLTLKNTLGLNGSTLTSNSTYLTYDYCGNDYINIAWGRSVMDMAVGFFALALLGASLGLFYSIAKDAGIIGK